jgi:hypothetical protein
MNWIVVGFVAVASSVFSSAASARADTAATVQKKIDGALKSARSFSVTTLYPAQAYSATLVYVAPDRSRLAVAVAATTTDVISVGNAVYTSKNGAVFEKAAVVAGDGAAAAPLGSVNVGAIRADVAIDGVAYGAFETTLPLGTVVTLTCAYDNRSFRLARCVSSDVTRTYGSYDDPKNVVEPPAGFVEASPAPKDGHQ